MSDIYDINTIEPGGNTRCAGCGSSHRPMQIMSRHGIVAAFCTSQFTCDEDREFTPTCVYCDEHFVDGMDLKCQHAPEENGKKHSTIDIRPELERKRRDAAEKAKRDARQKALKSEKTQDSPVFFISIGAAFSSSLSDQMDLLKKTLEKQKFEMSFQIPPQKHEDFAPRGTVQVDHINKIRYVSTGKEWITMGEAAWTAWSRDHFTIAPGQIPGEPGNLNIKQTEDYYDQMKIESKSYYTDNLDNRYVEDSYIDNDDWWNQSLTPKKYKK